MSDQTYQEFNNQANEALLCLQLLSAHTDCQTWAWLSAIIAVVFFFITMATESKIWLFLSITSALISAYSFWRVSVIAATLADKGVFL